LSSGEANTKELCDEVKEDMAGNNPRQVSLGTSNIRGTLRLCDDCFKRSLNETKAEARLSLTDTKTESRLQLSPQAIFSDGKDGGE
tara:strand:+ start:160 stop:417 length:258 start_codon:yes stop_codon:yes gene_type:complete